MTYYGASDVLGSRELALTRPKPPTLSTKNQKPKPDVLGSERYSVKHLDAMTRKGAEVSVLAEPPREVWVDCRGTHVEDEDLLNLVSEPDLVYLSVNDCKVTTSGVAAIGEKPKLSSLGIGRFSRGWLGSQVC